MNGMGGIGKTTLAAQYVNEQKENYNHIAWVQVETTLMNALIGNDRLLESLGIKLAGQVEEQTIIRELVRRMQNLDGENLMYDI